MAGETRERRRKRKSSKRPATEPAQRNDAATSVYLRLPEGAGFFAAADDVLEPESRELKTISTAFSYNPARPFPVRADTSTYAAQPMSLASCLPISVVMTLLPSACGSAWFVSRRSTLVPTRILGVSGRYTLTSGAHCHEAPATAAWLVIHNVDRVLLAAHMPNDARIHGGKGGEQQYLLRYGLVRDIVHQRKA